MRLSLLDEMALNRGIFLHNLENLTFNFTQDVAW